MAQPSGASQPVLVRIGVADIRQVQDHRLVTGRFYPVRASRVAAEEFGLVIQAPPDPGTAVKQGEVLAKLDTQLIQRQRIVVAASLDEARAMINQTQAQFDEAAATRQRFQSLVDGGGVTQQELDGAKRNAEVANAQLVTAQAALASRTAELQQLDIRITKMTVVAPFDGVTNAKSTEVGQWLEPGDQVVELGAINPIDAILDVPEMLVGYLHEGQSLDVTIDAIGRTRQGVVHRIIPSADQQSRTFPVMVRMDNADLALLPGMSAEAMLPTGDVVDAVTVPRDAVQLTPAGAQVVVNRGGVAEIVSVQLKFGIDDRFVVEGPINAGDQIVVEGNERVFPGQPLTVINPPQATP